MAHYQGRRAPPVSQYIANLNTIPTAADMTQQDFTNFDDDLALFTNTDFFDFDLNAPVAEVANFHDAQHAQQQQHVRSPNATDKIGYVNHSPYYGQLPPFPAQPVSGHSSAPTSPPNGLPFAGQMQQSQPTIPSMQHFTHVLTPQQPQQTPAQKNKAAAAGMTGTISSPVEFEEHSRVAAEEDKRRRNTAASARFRVKKKQREQALEKTAREMSEKVQILEARIGQLEMENQWLKGLITEKNVPLEGSPMDGKKTAKDSESAKKADQLKEDLERSPGDKKRGVGTVDKATKA